MADETRIDRWLCAVRLVKTRPMATQLCDGGHVRVNGNPAKPSAKVHAGDVVHALIAERERIGRLPDRLRLAPAPAADALQSSSWHHHTSHREHPAARFADPIVQPTHARPHGHRTRDEG
jgi:ribosomal 50S subunit-recycling heat shock protein